MMQEVGRHMQTLLRQTLRRHHLVQREINMSILEQKMWLETFPLQVVVESKLIRRHQQYGLQHLLDHIIVTLESMFMEHVRIIEGEVVLRI